MSKAYKWLVPGTRIRLNGELDTKVIGKPHRVRGVWVITVEDSSPMPIWVRSTCGPDQYEVACYDLESQKPRKE